MNKLLYLFKGGSVGRISGAATTNQLHRCIPWTGRLLVDCFSDFNLKIQTKLERL